MIFFSWFQAVYAVQNAIEVSNIRNLLTVMVYQFLQANNEFIVIIYNANLRVGQTLDNKPTARI